MTTLTIQQEKSSDRRNQEKRDGRIKKRRTARWGYPLSFRQKEKRKKGVAEKVAAPLHKRLNFIIIYVIVYM